MELNGQEKKVFCGKGERRKLSFKDRVQRKLGDCESQKEEKAPVPDTALNEETFKN